MGKYIQEFFSIFLGQYYFHHYLIIVYVKTCQQRLVFFPCERTFFSSVRLSFCVSCLGTCYMWVTSKPPLYQFPTWLSWQVSPGWLAFNISLYCQHSPFTVTLLIPRIKFTPLLINMLTSFWHFISCCNHVIFSFYLNPVNLSLTLFIYILHILQQ